MHTACGLGEARRQHAGHYVRNGLARDVAPATLCAMDVATTLRTAAEESVQAARGTEKAACRRVSVVAIEAVRIVRCEPLVIEARGPAGRAAAFGFAQRWRRARPAPRA